MININIKQKEVLATNAKNLFFVSVKN